MYDLSQRLNNHFDYCYHLFFCTLSIDIQEEISGWREDLYTVRKSAINLLGVISISKVGTRYCFIKFELYGLFELFSSLSFNAYRGLQREFQVMVLQLHPSVRKVKRASEIVCVVLWGSYWSFHFCQSFPFLVMLMHLILAFRKSEFKSMTPRYFGSPIL